MAGMLPGVECARRRRFHKNGSSENSQSRRSSFCLYTSNNETHHGSSLNSLRSIITQAYCQNEMLGEVAREAKERLDERFRKPESTRPNTSRESIKGGIVLGELHTEVVGSKKKSGGSKRFSWSKLSWKACEQEECAICLEGFKVAQTMVHLPCEHRFHDRCLVPWLESNAHCPCCRMEILGNLGD